MEERTLLLPYNLQFFAESEGAEGETVTDPAEPSTDDSINTLDNTEGGEQKEETPTVQSAEENAKYAAARRGAEQELNDYKAKMRSIDDAFAERFKGYENPITHAPILSQQDYLDALDAQQHLEATKQLETAGIDANLLERVINSNPVVKQAQEILRETQNQQVEQMIAQDLQYIMKLDPEVKSMADIQNSENAGEIMRLVQSGLRLADAYKVANLEKLMERNRNASKQAAINNYKGTQHLNATSSIDAPDDGSVDIPSTELKQWQLAYPDLSMKELRKKYNQTL